MFSKLNRDVSKIFLGYIFVLAGCVKDNLILVYNVFCFFLKYHLFYVHHVLLRKMYLHSTDSSTKDSTVVELDWHL